MSRPASTAKREVYEVIKAALSELGRTDEPYSYGAVRDGETQQQILYFDLPRVSPLQFNIIASENLDRAQLIGKIKAAITQRLEVA